MTKKHRKTLSVVIALAFLVTLVLPVGAALGATQNASQLAQIPRGISGSYVTTTTGEDQNLGTVTVRLPETSDVSRYADKVVISATLPSGVTFKQNYEPGSANNPFSSVVSVVYDAYQVSEQLVSGSKDRVEFTVQPQNSNNPLEFAATINFNHVNIDSSVSGDVKAAVEVRGLKGNQTAFTLTGSVLIARVTGADEVTISADTPESLTVGSDKKAARITVTEAAYGLLNQSKGIVLEIVSPGVSFTKTTNGNAKVDVKPAYFQLPTLETDANGNVIGIPFDTNVSDYTKAQIVPLAGYTTTGVAGRVELTPHLNLDPTATGQVQIKVTVYGKSGKSYSQTVTVGNVAGAVAFTVSETKYTGGTVYTGYAPGVIKESGNAASVKVKSVGGNFPANTIVTLELAGAKFDSTSPLQVTPSSTVQVFNNNRSAWFEVTGSGVDEITLTNFKVYADADASAGDLVLKISLSTGNIDKPEVVIGKVAKALKVSASGAPNVTYLGRGQAAGDITITEAKPGILTKDSSNNDYRVIKLVLPEGIQFTEKPSVNVTAGNMKVDSTLTDDSTLTLTVTRASGVASTITISNIKYDVTRLALDGDVTVKVVGVDASSAISSGAGTTPDQWKGKTLATVVNAKVVSETAAPAPAPTKREASFVIGSTTYKVNGKDSTMDVAPYIDAASGRTYLPVRYVAYALGVSEDNIFYSNGVVSLLKDGRAVQMTIGSKVLRVNGVDITMDAAPVIKDGRTMLPFRWIATALGASVKWDEATKTVTMTIE